jgi:energy-coupling factor transport system permease protein
MFKINIITQLLTFFMFAIVLNLLTLKVLLVVSVFLLFLLIIMKNYQFYRLFKRLKWVYLVMFAIFSFNTPGEHVKAWPFLFSPTYEGIIAGFEQLLRITTMLAVLSMLLISNDRQKFISGLYFLFSPLKCLGLDIERFAARLWLTLHYVEAQQSSPKIVPMVKNLNSSLSAIFKDAIHDEVTISLEKPIFSLFDYLFITLISVLFFAVLFKVIV